MAGRVPEFRPANMNQTQQRFLDRLGRLSGEIAEAYSPRAVSPRLRPLAGSPRW